MNVGLRGLLSHRAARVLGGHCYICFVWCLDEYTTMIVVDRTLDAHFS